MQINNPIDILLVEDNPGDVELTRTALRRGKVASNLSVVVNGEDAIKFLRREGEFRSAPAPDLILLDLNLPGKDGREVLVEVKQDQELARIPVVVMTSSEAEQDIVKSYLAHANCYVTKPVDLQQFLKVIASIEEFWLTIARLPPKSLF